MTYHDAQGHIESSQALQFSLRTRLLLIMPQMASNSNVCCCALPDGMTKISWVGFSTAPLTHRRGERPTIRMSQGEDLPKTIGKEIQEVVEASPKPSKWYIKRPGQSGGRVAFEPPPIWRTRKLKVK